LRPDAPFQTLHGRALQGNIPQRADTSRVWRSGGTCSGWRSGGTFSGWLIGGGDKSGRQEAGNNKDGNCGYDNEPIHSSHLLTMSIKTFE
jgi:hypothetical protein